MNKNTIDVGIMMVIIILIGLVFVSFMTYADYLDDVSTCERMQSYGYEARVEGSFFENGIACMVYMQDGTKVYSYDFNIADYKKPRQIK